MLAVAAPRGLRLLVELGERPTGPAGAGELAARAATGAKHEVVGDTAEAAQSFDAFGHQVDGRVTSDLAYGRLAEGVGVEEGVAGVAAGEGLRWRRKSSAWVGRGSPVPPMVGDMLVYTWCGKPYRSARDFIASSS